MSTTLVCQECDNDGFTWGKIGGSGDPVMDVPFVCESCGGDKHAVCARCGNVKATHEDYNGEASCDACDRCDTCQNYVTHTNDFGNWCDDCDYGWRSRGSREAYDDLHGRESWEDR
jgi:hypothetical protein